MCGISMLSQGTTGYLKHWKMYGTNDSGEFVNLSKIYYQVFHFHPARGTIKKNRGRNMTTMSDDSNGSNESSSDGRELSESREALSEELTANAERVEKSGSRESGDKPSIEDVGFGHIPAKVREQASETNDSSED